MSLKSLLAIVSNISRGKLTRFGIKSQLTLLCWTQWLSEHYENVKTNWIQQLSPDLIESAITTSSCQRSSHSLGYLPQRLNLTPDLNLCLNYFLNTRLDASCISALSITTTQWAQGSLGIYCRIILWEVTDFESNTIVLMFQLWNTQKWNT